MNHSSRAALGCSVSQASKAEVDDARQVEQRQDGQPPARRGFGKTRKKWSSSAGSSARKTSSARRNAFQSASRGPAGVSDVDREGREAERQNTRAAPARSRETVKRPMTRYRNPTKARKR